MNKNEHSIELIPVTRLDKFGQAHNCHIPVNQISLIEEVEYGLNPEEKTIIELTTGRAIHITQTVGELLAEIGRYSPNN